MQKNFFRIFMMSAIVAALIMTGCSRLGKEKEPAPAEFESGEQVGLSERSVTMVISEGETAKLDQIEGLLAADLRGSECYEEIYRWSQANPNVAVRYTVPLPNGDHVTNEISALNLTELRHDEVEELIKAASCLPHLKRIELGEPRADFGWDDVAAIIQAFPELYINYTGDLYGKNVKLDDTVLDLKFIPINDGGEKVRQVVRCMPKLKYLDMDSCGLSNEEMAALRDEFPEVKVVWRVWFGNQYSVRTDVEKILASRPTVGGDLEQGNCEALMYCTDVKYLDIGHNEPLAYFEFLRYMPKLEVCILAMTWLEDLSPLENCTEMEYLEIQTTRVNDLSPLAGMTKLKHLNICNMMNGQIDLTPLYGMKELERLWIGGWTGRDMAQVEELQKLLPRCNINTGAGDPTEGGWRWVGANDWGAFIPHPRYRELQEQFGYTDKDFAFYWNDPIYSEYLNNK